MKNKKLHSVISVSLWVVIAVAGGYAATGVWRWSMLAIAVIGAALHLLPFRRPAPAVHCSFCGRPPPDGRTLVHGPDVRICSSCVAVAQQIVSRGDAGGRSFLE